MTENEIAKIVVDAAYHIHRRLGPGLLPIDCWFSLRLGVFARDLFGSGLSGLGF